MSSILRGILVSLAVVGFCIPQSVLAADMLSQQQPVVADVALSGDGVLFGQVVDPQGVSLAQIPVSLLSQDREIAAVATDQNGYFAVGGLGDGVYQIATAAGQGTYRLWTPGMAPPSAEQGVLIVYGEGTVRGQYGPIGHWLCNPWVIAGIVATAVAVPVAISNSKKSPSSP